MKPWDRFKYLQGNLREIIKRTTLVEVEVGRYRLEKSFYGARVEIIKDNLETLRSGSYVVSMAEYRLILRDYYYNRGNYCEAAIELIRCEAELEKLRDQAARVEAEMDSLIKEMENSVVVLPFRRTDEQE
jgi:uncharacterized protein (UPF0262 family)